MTRLIVVDEEQTDMIGTNTTTTPRPRTPRLACSIQAPPEMVTWKHVGQGSDVVDRAFEALRYGGRGHGEVPSGAAAVESRLVQGQQGGGGVRSWERHAEQNGGYGEQQQQQIYCASGERRGASFGGFEEDCGRREGGDSAKPGHDHTDRQQATAHGEGHTVSHVDRQQQRRQYACNEQQYDGGRGYAHGDRPPLHFQDRSSEYQDQHGYGEIQKQENDNMYNGGIEGNVLNHKNSGDAMSLGKEGNGSTYGTGQYHERRHGIEYQYSHDGQRIQHYNQKQEYEEHQRQHNQEQKHRQEQNRQPQTMPPVVASPAQHHLQVAPVTSAQSAIPNHICCHNVPYDVCLHKKTHFSGISAELEAAMEQMVMMEGCVLKEMQKECKRLLEIKNALKSVCTTDGSGSQGQQKTSPSFGAQHTETAVPQYTPAQPYPPPVTLQQQQQYSHWSQHQGAPPAAIIERSSFEARHDESGRLSAYSGGTGMDGGGLSSHKYPQQSYQQPAWDKDIYQNENPIQAQEILEVDAEMWKNAHADRVDASNDPQWKRTDFPWSSEMDRQNSELFGNASFRLHQRAVINATMAGRDVFVLMPTGGGKSLCYQLPAVLSQGVTIVITPLVSLIQDQVFHLTNLGISARFLASYERGQDGGETVKEVMRGSIKVLFLTPEKLEQSGSTRTMLERLYSEERLARVVIDEAHCVSQWGHGMKQCIFISPPPLDC